MEAKVKFFLNQSKSQFDLVGYKISTNETVDSFKDFLDEEAIEYRNGLGAFGYEILDETKVTFFLTN